MNSEQNHGLVCALTALLHAYSPVSPFFFLPLFSLSLSSLSLLSLSSPLIPVLPSTFSSLPPSHSPFPLHPSVGTCSRHPSGSGSRWSPNCSQGTIEEGSCQWKCDDRGAGHKLCQEGIQDSVPHIYPRSRLPPQEKRGGEIRIRTICRRNSKHNRLLKA